MLLLCKIIILFCVHWQVHVPNNVNITLWDVNIELKKGLQCYLCTSQWGHCKLSSTINVDIVIGNEIFENFMNMISYMKILMFVGMFTLHCIMYTLDKNQRSNFFRNLHCIMQCSWFDIDQNLELFHARFMDLNARPSLYICSFHVFLP